jgi:hypothetical protein
LTGGRWEERPHLIPFEALVDENGKCLIENYSLSLLKSGRDLLRLRTQIESQSASLVMADPFYDLAALLPANRQTNQHATQSDGSRCSMALAKLMPNALY